MTPSLSKSKAVLSGLDGSNPLAFLAAIGTLRTTVKAFPEQQVRLSWSVITGWRPILHLGVDFDEDTFVDALQNCLSGTDERPEFRQLGDDLHVAPDAFREFAESAARAASPVDHSTADFAAAFGCDMTVVDSAGKTTIQDTALRTMAGAGHQHFLGFMRNIIRATTADHVRKALFGQWRYDDPVQNLTLRWDPIDDVRYALRWRDPSGDPLRRVSGSMLGANRLAIEGLPLITTVPDSTRLRTTGFRGRKSSDTFWTWPLWEAPLSLDVVRSILALDGLQSDVPDRSLLREYGIGEVFRAQRLTIGKVRNFTVGRSI
jgi:hypothetical protein